MLSILHRSHKELSLQYQSRKYESSSRILILLVYLLLFSHTKAVLSNIAVAFLKENAIAVKMNR
jgi:hypothetical protein